MTEALPSLPFQDGGNKGGSAFFITVSGIISWFIKIENRKVYCSYSHKKIQNVSSVV